MNGTAPNGNRSAAPPVNINTATERELRSLPGIGDELAARIVAYRNRSGPFRKPEHLLMVDGISEGRLHDILPLITVE
jgi:competence protein ComEA